MSLKAEYLEKAKLRARNTYLRQLRIFTRDTVDDYEFTDRYQLILKYEIESLNLLSYFFQMLWLWLLNFNLQNFAYCLMLKLSMNYKVISKRSSPSF